jgi:hypothetical protein
MPDLLHYTLNTGHTRASPRAEVADDILDLLRPLTAPGDHPVPRTPGYRVVVPETGGGIVFTVYRHDVPLVTCGVADTPEASAELWPILERFYLGLTDSGPLASVGFSAPHQPEGLPWLAVVLVSPQVPPWVADLERCMAWAFLSGAG